jgi:hypothetical protein
MSYVSSDYLVSYKILMRSMIENSLKPLNLKLIVVKKA